MSKRAGNFSMQKLKDSIEINVHHTLCFQQWALSAGFYLYQLNAFSPMSS